MAEVIVDIPVTLKKIQLQSSHVRRNSTGQLGFQVQSRYLCSSPASCHDACKYGTKHVFETNPRSPLSRKLTETAGDGNVSIKTINLVQRKKTSEVSSNPLPDSKSNSLRGQTKIKKEFPASTNKPAVSSKPALPLGKGTDVFAKLNSGLKPKPLHRKEPVMPTLGYLSTRRYSEVIISRGMDALKPSPVGSSSSRRTESIDKSKESKMMKKNNLAQPMVSPSSKPSAKRASSTKAGNDREPGRMSLLKSQSGVGTAEPQQPIVETVPEKTLYVIETKPENLSVEPTPTVSETTRAPSLPPPTVEDKSLLMNRNGKHTSRSPTSSEHKKTQHTQYRTHSTLLSSSSSSSSSLATKNRSLRHTQNRTCRTELPSSSLSLFSSSLYASRSLQTDKSGPISGCSGTKAGNKIESEKVECKSGLQKIQRDAKEKDNSPMKLKFRKPKFMDVQHEESIPRRLRFKRGKVQSEIQTAERNSITDCGGTETKNRITNHVEQKSKSRRVQKVGSKHKNSSALKLNVRKVKLANVQCENRSPHSLKIEQGKVMGEKQNFKPDTKKRSIRRAGARDESSVARAESAEIVLRPRAVQRKRSVEKLNKMIEETASKLAVTRKSKVKALVGAFESVISLQDTKSSAATITH